MPKILVVDDSGTDRCIIAGLLADAPDMHLDFASNGAEALQKLAQAQPDLVVTDLIMPEVNGLQLVDAVRQRYPLVPVILLTSQGSEEVAVQALHRGAASYVPKQLLARDLAETVAKVLGVSGRERSHSRLLGCMTESTSAFVMDNDPELIPPLVSYLQESLGQLGVCDEADRTRVGVALEEALSNALIHGNLEIGSDLRGGDDCAYCDAIARRRREPPYRDRRIHVEASLGAAGATFVVRDEGRGFDPAALPDPTDPANLEKCSGRGILLMRTFMDEVHFSERGNAVTLIKRCRRG